MAGQLDEAVSVTLDGSGTGTVFLRPRTPRQRWQISNVAIDGDSATEPEFRLYLGNPVPQQQVASSFSGNTDSMAAGFELRPGQRLCGRWSGGTPGAVMTLSVYGTFDVAR